MSQPHCCSAKALSPHPLKCSSFGCRCEFSPCYKKKKRNPYEIDEQYPQTLVGLINCVMRDAPSFSPEASHAALPACSTRAASEHSLCLSKLVRLQGPHLYGDKFSIARLAKTNCL